QDDDRRMGSIGHRDGYVGPPDQPATVGWTEWQRLAECHEPPGPGQLGLVSTHSERMVQHVVVRVPSKWSVGRCRTQLTAWPWPRQLEHLALQELRAQREPWQPLRTAHRDVQHLESHGVQPGEQRARIEQLRRGYVGVRRRNRA